MVELTVRVVVPETVIVGCMDALRLRDGMVERLAWPVNPFVDVRVMVEVPVERVPIVRAVGLAARLKSGPVTMTATLAEWARGPLDPSTSTK